MQRSCAYLFVLVLWLGAEAGLLLHHHDAGEGFDDDGDCAACLAANAPCGGLQALPIIPLRPARAVQRRDLQLTSAPRHVDADAPLARGPPSDG